MNRDEFKAAAFKRLDAVPKEQRDLEALKICSELTNGIETDQIRRIIEEVKFDPLCAHLKVYRDFIEMMEGKLALREINGNE